MKNKISLFLLVVFLTACDNSGIKKSIIEVEKFHSEYNNKKFNEIYNSMVTQEFQDSTSENDFSLFMNKTYNIIGKHRSSVLKKSNDIKSLLGNPKVELIYSSTYENYILDELFIFEEKSGGYKIKKITYDDASAVKKSKDTD